MRRRVFGVTTFALVVLSLVAMAFLLPLRDPRFSDPRASSHLEAREARPADAPPGSCTIGGVVTALWSGAPLEGVGVSIYLEKRDLQWSTTTDTGGRWAVTGLPDGAYGLLMRKDGLRTQYAFSPPVVVSATRPVRTLDVRMARGGTLRGQVLSGEGAPIADVSVAALRLLDAATPPRFEGHESHTDGAGTFALTGLPDGTFILAARPRSWSRRPGSPIAVTTFFPSASQEAEARRFAVGDGVVISGLRLVMRSARALAIAGRVVTADGAPAAAEVSIDHYEELFNTTSGTMTPQPPGTFRYDGLVPGRYRLLAKRRAAHGWEAASELVTLSDHDVPDLVLTLRPPARIRGRVVAERGVLRAPTALRLSVMPAGERSGGVGFDDSGLVGENGTFEILSAEQPAKLVAIQPTHGWEISSVKVNGNVQADGVLTYAPGAIVENVEVVLGRRASVIAGTVSGAVSTGCVIVLRRDDSGRTRCVASMNVRDGEFRSLPIVAGSYRVAATCAGREPPETLEELWTRATPVTLADDEIRTVRLQD